MKKAVIRALMILLLAAAGNFVPQMVSAQTATTTQEKLDKLKNDYQEGKITLEDYQKQSNALLQYDAPVFTTVPPGDHFVRGGRCLIAGSTLLIAGSAIAGTSILWTNIDYSGVAFYTTLSGGCALALIGLITDIAGGSQFLKGGKKLNALKIGQQTSYIQFAPSSEGVGLAMKF